MQNPPDGCFETALVVRYADTDAQGVVFFANYLTYMDEASTVFLRQTGSPYEALLEAGIDLVYADAHVRYRSSLRHGDPVQVAGWVSRIGNTSCTSSFEVSTGGRQAATGELVHVCIDRSTRAPVAVPDALRGALQRSLVTAAP